MKRFAITSMTMELFTKITRRDNMNTIKNKTTSLFNTYKFFFAFGIFYFLVFIAIAFFVSEFLFKSKQDFFEPIVPMVSVLFTGLIGLIQKQFEDQKIKKSQQDLERSKMETNKEMQLFQKRLDFSEMFLHKLELLFQDGKIISHLGNNELNELIFLITKLKIHFNDEKTEKIISSCTTIIESLNKSKDLNLELDYQEIGNELFRIAYFLRKGLTEVINEDFTEDKKMESERIESETNLGDLVNSIAENNRLNEAISNNSEENKENSNSHEKDRVWHVNIGETFGVIQGDQYRCWEDMKTNGFWSAGGAKRYADGVKKLQGKDIIYAYLSGRGYVARGKVMNEAILVRDFFKGKDSAIEGLKSNQFKENLKNTKFEGFHSVDIGEYAVSVEWEYPREKDKPVTNKDLKISPMTICKMNEGNLGILKKEFQESSMRSI